MPNEPSCSCCGTPARIYQLTGHDPECIWHDNEMYRLAKEWKDSQEDANWKQRYDLVVGFLLKEVEYLVEERASREQDG